MVTPLCTRTKSLRINLSLAHTVSTCFQNSSTIIERPGMRVVYDSRHVLHDPTTEVQYGVPMHMYEVPARVESIRAALLADDEFSFTDPTEHGLGPVTAVHHEGLVRFLAEAWSLWRDQGGGGGA